MTVYKKKEYSLKIVKLQMKKVNENFDSFF